MTTHSEIGASSMYRWSACAGSVRLAHGLTSISSKYAEEGTQAHEIASEVIERYLRTGKIVWPKTISGEMQAAIQIYIDAIFADPPVRSAGDLVFIEQKFDLSELYTGPFGPPGGTCDAVIYRASSKKLQVFDLKYGAGIFVEVEHNDQLLYYALGALLHTKLPVSEVEVAIVQPRHEGSDPVRRWTFPAIDILDFADRLVKSARATENPKAPLVPGDHCRFCPAAGVCPKLEEKALEVAKAEFTDEFPMDDAKTSLPYDPQKLSKTLQGLPVLEAFIAQVRKLAYTEAVNGRTPPGFKLVDKQARRKWKIADEAELVEELRSAFSLPADTFYDHSVKSPAQVEKLLAKAGKQKLKEFVESKSSGMTLVSEDDPRPEIQVVPGAEFDLIEEDLAENGS
jgi:hypothetical protein